MNPPTVVSGPRRLILINSGKFDYAEIDLTRPFQLVGVNGLGKTALISTLQYLYLDSQRDMRFGQHTTDESRRFYFKGATSLIIYECDTPQGVQSIGVRSEGAVSAYELERYAWRGDFVRSDFVNDETRPRPWSEIRPRLEAKGLVPLAETIDLRRLLGAVDKDAKTTWGLVPLADHRDYPRFRQTFQRLLQLRDIRQEDLKQLLADCAKLGPSQREIDLTAEFAKDLQSINRDRFEVQMLQKAGPLVSEVRGLFDQELSARAVAHTVVRELRDRHRDYTVSHQREFIAIRATKDQSDQELVRLNEEKLKLQNSLKDASLGEGEVRAQLKGLETARARFKDFVVEIEIQARDRLAEELAGIESRLRNPPKETAEVISRQIEEKQLLLQQRTVAAQRIKDLFITWLRHRLPPEDVDRLAALFHRGLLESFMNEQVQVKDEAKLLLHLKAAAARCDARSYEDDALALDFPAGAIRQAAQTGNAAASDQEIRVLTREIENLQTDLETIARLKELRQRRPIAQAEHLERSQRVLEYDAFQKLIAHEEVWRAQMKDYRDAQTGVQELLDKNEVARTEASNLGKEAIAKFDKLEAERAKVLAEAGNFPVATGEDPGVTPLGKAAVKELPTVLSAVFVSARELCLAAQRCAQSLDDKIELLDRDFAAASFVYDRAAPVEARLRRLEIEISSLAERTANSEQRWRGVLVSARAGFQAMLKSLEAVNKAVRKLNKELGKIEFSSIADVSLEVVENQTAVTEYRRQADDAMEPSLFEMPADADNKILQFTKLLQDRPKLALFDLFSLRCVVVRHDGQKNYYDDFDSVESTGTTIVLKVTLNLLVLRDLLIPGKARIPFYLDEVHALDRQNFGNILQLSERLGFVGIYAAPTSAGGLKRYVHLVPDIKGRLVVTQAHLKEIVRLPEATSTGELPPATAS